MPLGITQTLAWASSYYLPAILAEPIARDTGVTPSAVFAALSGALLIPALIGPRVGKTIDRIGGRQVLMLSNLFFALGLGLLAASGSCLFANGYLTAGGDSMAETKKMIEDAGFFIDRFEG